MLAVEPEVLVELVVGEEVVAAPIGSWTNALIGVIALWLFSAG